MLNDYSIQPQQSQSEFDWNQIEFDAQLTFPIPLQAVVHI